MNHGLTIAIDEESKHVLELSELAKKDPEFYKYLQENDTELLQFAAAQDDRDDMIDVEEGSSSRILKEETIRQWQTAILQTRSLRALRSLIVAFRCAANMNEEDKSEAAWIIDDAESEHEVIPLAQ